MPTWGLGAWGHYWGASQEAAPESTVVTPWATTRALRGYPPVGPEVYVRERFREDSPAGVTLGPPDTMRRAPVIVPPPKVYSLSVDYDGTNDFGNYSAAMVQPATWTWVQWFRWDVRQGTCWSWTDTGTGQVVVYVVGVNLVVYVTGGVTNQLVGQGFTGDWHLAAVKRVGNAYSTSFDGSDWVAKGSSSTFTDPDDMEVSANSATLDGQIAYQGLWDRELTNAELAAMYADPQSRLADAIHAWEFGNTAGDSTDVAGTIQDVGTDGGWDLVSTNQAADDIDSAYPVARSVDFDGINDHAVSGTLTSPGTTCTLGAWIKIQNVATYRSFLGLRDESGEVFRLQANNSNYFVGYDGSTVWQSDGTIPIDQWVFCAFRYDHLGSTTAMWIDTTKKDLSTARTMADYTTIQLGRNGALGQPFAGRIAGAFIHDGLLSDAQIAAMAADVTADWSALGLTHWYRCGLGDTYPTLTDSGSGAEDLTMTSMAAGDFVWDNKQNEP